mmetsp:Transcript_2297/g.5482  ORF Transcript_2297/g.5482 Transcript_2297/m.5482 type:complete len:209 (+) Transcript_2297:409-1035(+)
MSRCTIARCPRRAALKRGVSPEDPLRWSTCAPRASSSSAVSTQRAPHPNVTQCRGHSPSLAVPWLGLAPHSDSSIVRHPTADSCAAKCEKEAPCLPTRAKGSARSRTSAARKPATSSEDRNPSNSLSSPRFSLRSGCSSPTPPALAPLPLALEWEAPRAQSPLALVTQSKCRHDPVDCGSASSAVAPRTTGTSHVLHDIDGAARRGGV